MIQLGNLRIEVNFDKIIEKKNIPTVTSSNTQLNHFLMMQVFTELIHNRRRHEDDRGPTVVATKLLLSGIECINGFKGLLNYTRSLEFAGDIRNGIVKLGIVSFIYENTFSIYIIRIRLTFMEETVHLFSISHFTF